MTVIIFHDIEVMRENKTSEPNVTKIPVIRRDGCKTGLARSSFDVWRFGLPTGDGRSFRVSFRSVRVMCRRIMRWPALLMVVR